MKIVYLADAPYVHEQRWITHFAGLGHECHVISFRPATIEGASVHHVEGFERLGKARYLLQARRVATSVQSLKPDLVHAFHLTSYGFLGALSGVRPYILSVLGMDIFEAPGHSPFHSWLTRYSLAKATEVTATGLHLATATARYAPRGRPVTLVPYGVDLERFRPAVRPPADEVVVGTVARLSPEKGLAYLLEAFAILRSSLPTPLRLRIAGEGPARAQLQKQAEHLGIAATTEFVGWVEHEDLPGFLHSLDIFALPSLHESFGVAAAEASAIGLPVVASNTQGLPDVVVDRLTGRLVPPKQPEALAKAMSPLAEDPDLRQRMGAAGRQFIAEHYDWSRNVRQMEHVYEVALAGRKQQSVPTLT
jgi:L-malate glycosyltransferase